jgi:hypothetical protein
MTTGTDNRNIKQIVKSILQSNQIDNLKLEVDLVSAWHRYVNERQEGLTPAETRAKITSEFGLLGFVGMSDLARERSRMAQIIMDTMRLNVEEDRPEWTAIIDFCLDMDKKGQTVKKYQEWRDSDLFNSPKTHQIAMKPKLIKTTWPQAFPPEVEAKVENEGGSGYYA